MHVLACVAVLLCSLSRCVIAFEPPVTAIRGKSVEEVLRELTADLDKESQDSKELTRVYTRLHRLLYHRQLLPLSTLAGGERGGPLDRIAADAGVAKFIERYSAQAGTSAPAGPRCLEWQAHQTGYAARMPFCREIWSADFGSPTRVDNATRTFTMDIDNPRTRQHMQAGRRVVHVHMRGEGVPEKEEWTSRVCWEDQGYFDVVVCTFVFGHIRLPYQAADTLRHWLKVDGKLLFVVNFMSGAPRIQQDHNFDHFRFSVDGALSLLTSAGFRIEDVWTGGDPLTANAFMMGFGQHDFAHEEVANNAALHELAVTNLPHLPGDGAYLSSVIIASATAKPSPKGALQAAKDLHSRVVRPGL